MILVEYIDHIEGCWALSFLTIIISRSLCTQVAFLPDLPNLQKITPQPFNQHNQVYVDPGLRLLGTQLSYDHYFKIPLHPSCILAGLAQPTKNHSPAFQPA